MPVTLPNVLVSGELDFESEGVQAIALVEQYYKRGLIEVHIEAYADVLNASGKKIKVTDPTEFILFGGPEVIVKKFSFFVLPSSFAEIRIVTPPWYANDSVTEGGSPKRRLKSVPSHLKSCASPRKSSTT